MTLSRREFIVTTGAVALSATTARAQAGQELWFNKVTRWGQTNTSAMDVRNYDVEFWRGQWRRTGIQAIIPNGVAGFATFPSRNPLLETSEFAPDRDLLGEITKAARADGLYVASRMDSFVLTPKISAAYPQWLTRDAQGRPGKTMCINSPFRETHVYAVYREVIERYRVDAFTDNGGVSGGPLCYCEFCKARWAREVGGPMPARYSLDDPIFRRWRRWNTAVTMENWEATNAFTKKVGGPGCAYIGLVRKFSTLNREIATRADLLMMDCQSRNDAASFREHADEGRYMRSILGWDKPVAPCTSMTQHSHGYFRLTADPALETRMYMQAGFAGGFNLWWHHPTAYSEDRRSFEIAAPTFAWQRRHEALLTHAVPVATAGVVRSDDNAVFFGHDAPVIYQPGYISRVTQVPYRGMVKALFESRIPYYPVHIADLARHGKDLPVLVLPNIGGMTDAECAAVREYVRTGGSIVVTGMTSLYDGDGEPRRDFGLADVLGVSLAATAPKRTFFAEAVEDSYFALPSGGAGARHPALAGLEETQVIPYGGSAIPLRVAPDRQVLATFAVAHDGRPPTGDGERPCLIVGTFGRGRVAFMPNDLDHRYLDDPHPDQALLIGNLLRWCAGEGPLPVEFDGPGYVGAYLYRKNGVSLVHLLNGSGVDNGEQIAERAYPVGPLKVRVKAPGRGTSVKLAASGAILRGTRSGDIVEFTLPRLEEYELAVLE
jgi:hypothetical protein